MLRSEVEWFPRFIRYCHYHLLIMPEDEEGSVIQDNAMLKCVADCEGYQKVQTILDTYRETAFSDLVHRMALGAKIYSEDQYIKFFFKKEELPIIDPFRNNLHPAP